MAERPASGGPDVVWHHIWEGCLKRGWSIDDAARHFGVTGKTVRKWRRQPPHTWKMTLAVAYRIALELQVSLDYLVGRWVDETGLPLPVVRRGNGQGEEE